MVSLMANEYLSLKNYYNDQKESIFMPIVIPLLFNILYTLQVKVGRNLLFRY